MFYPVTTLLIQETEHWLPIPGYEGLYEVSDLGRVRSLDREVTCNNRWGGITSWLQHGRVLKPRPNEWNRYSVYLCRNGEKHSRKVHQLVLEAFVGPRPEGYLACHKNDVSNDNRLENLYWGTQRDNTRDQQANGKYRNHNSERTHCQRGHPFDEENTLLVWHSTRESFQRKCKVCHDAYEMSRERRRK